MTEGIEGSDNQDSFQGNVLGADSGMLLENGCINESGEFQNGLTEELR